MTKEQIYLKLKLPRALGYCQLNNLRSSLSKKLYN